MCFLRPLRGGIKSNSRFNKSVGNKNIGNNGDGTVTGIIGNQALQTTSKSMSGAVNEIKTMQDNFVKHTLDNCVLKYENKHFYALKMQNDSPIDTKEIGVCHIILNTNTGANSELHSIACSVKSYNNSPLGIEIINPSDQAYFMPSRNGYVFAGWNDANGNAFGVDSIADGKTFLAKWTANAYVLWLNANNGSVVPDRKSVSCGDTYGTLPIPARTGYSFLGWFTALSSGTQVSENTIMGAGDTTIYALWKDIVAPVITAVQTNPTASTLVYVNNIWARYLHMKITYTFSDNDGVTGYYWGKINPTSVNAVPWTSITGTTVTITRGYVASGVGGYTDGTYYFAVRDADGNFAVKESTAWFGNVLMSASSGTLRNTNRNKYVAILNTSSAPYIDVYTSYGTINPMDSGSIFQVNGADVAYSLSKTRSDCYMSYAFFD